MSFLVHLIYLSPIVAGVVILLGLPPRRTGVIATVIALVSATLVFVGYDRAISGYQFRSFLPLVTDWDLKFSVGVDGLSATMLLLTSIVALASVWLAPKVEEGENRYYACILFIAAGAAGAFASLDLFFFYAFHELALIPTFLMIGIWGSGNRQSAAWKITIYLSIGSIVLLVGLIGLYLLPSPDQRTFDIVKLQELAATGAFSGPGSRSVYLLLLLGFGTLVSLFPFHTWAPQAYASAPVPVTMLHAGVLKKFGLYGLLRVALPMMPDAARHWAWLLLILLAGNILYVGLATIAQKQLDLTLAYSSVMHMGYIFLGIASYNVIGLNGAALLMFAHGLSIAALFALSGELRKQTGTLNYLDLGGLATNMPTLSFVFGMATFASIGLPGFANFASELLVFFGAFKNSTPGAGFNEFQIVGTIALWGVVISSVYMLRAYRAIFMGERQARWQMVKDMPLSLGWTIILLIAALLIVGLVPRTVLDAVEPGIRLFVK
ncbi:MAG: NADH-quinone oxidoreductase subunit M [Verrucomicrobia bacterium]|nr:NADH-quinone oxidoreductase subunit M [Verrucomicrobiota bacterium]MBV8641199.1 NADH-quinone oxidoreductase subunit M [Verrucomicrobiota bacterium]